VKKYVGNSVASTPVTSFLTQQQRRKKIGQEKWRYFQQIPLILIAWKQ